MNKLLVFGGVSSISAALLHIAIIIGGPDWYRFFGAGEEFATMAEQGSYIPGLVTFGICVVLFIWGLYAFSGAGLTRRLPFLKFALVSISTIYCLRGTELFLLLIIEPNLVDAFTLCTSLASLTIGLAYAVGTKHIWSEI